MSMDPLAALDIKLSAQDFTPVLLPESQYPLQITKAYIHENKQTNKPSLAVTACTTQAWPSTKAGEQVPAGKEFTTYVGLGLPDDLDMSDTAAVREAERKRGLRLQNLVMAVFEIKNLEECPDLTMNTVNMMVGRQIVGKISIERSAQYGDQNRLDQVIAAA